jgi:hypothetical protein
MRTQLKRALRLSLMAGIAAIATACPDNGPKPPAGIEIVSGSGQTATAGSNVPIAPVVRVTAADSSPVSGATVRFAVTSGGGTVLATTATTGADGTATTAWKLGNTAGSNSISAKVDGVATGVTFTATGTAGLPATMTISAGADQTASAGSAVATPPAVKVVDANNNAVPSVTVTFAVTAGGGTLTGASATTNSSGIATVGSWTLGTAGTNSISASATGVTSVTFNATATASPATKLAVTRQPAGAVSGAAFTTQPQVTIQNAAGGTVATSTAAVTAAIGTGTGTLSGTTTVNAVAGVATFTNLAVTGTSAVTLTFTSTGLTSATSSSFTPTSTSGGGLNLTIDGMYMTQATQTYTNDVPIVANRAALVRVFVKASATNTAAPAVKVTTYQSNGTTVIKEYTITSPSLSVPQTVDESNLTSSWNVQIPAAEVVAGMRMLAEVDPANTVTESSDSDNKFPVSGTPMTLNAAAVPTMKITFIPVTQGGGTGEISTGNLSTYLDYPTRVYPWATVDAVIAPTYTYSQTLNGASYDATWTTLLSEISSKRTADAVTDRYYYAVIKPSYSNGGTGFGQIGGPNAIGVDVKFNGTVNPNTVGSTNYTSMTVAHEIGHNFGRNHVNCGGPSNPDASYPYSPTSSIGAFGWDPTNNVLRPKDGWVDFMSYCQPLWISDYTYKAVLTWRSTHFGPPTAAKGKALLVWGRIGPSGVVLEPAFEIDAPASLPERAGRYAVQAVDDAGRQIFALSFEGYEVDHATGERNFSFAVPLSAAGGTEIAELRLMDGTRLMTRRPRTMLNTAAAAEQALTATRLRPLTGAPRARLEWDASVYPMAMVRDPVTGEVISFLRGGTGDLGAQRGEVDVLFSNGVRSVKRRMQISR